nr:MAG TPA: hypothetical protein [Caudoviricetes sp.]
MNQTCFSHYVTHIEDVSVTVTDCYPLADLYAFGMRSLHEE